MPRMDGTGPDKQGLKTGRKLGNCVPEKDKDLSKLGKGMGKRRNVICIDEGQGKRMKTDNHK